MKVGGAPIGVKRRAVLIPSPDAIYLLASRVRPYALVFAVADLALS
jgi:hypothetical protein